MINPQQIVANTVMDIFTVWPSEQMFELAGTTSPEWIP